MKAVFVKNHENIQNPTADPLPEHRMMFINRVLQKIIAGHLSQIDLEALGSLISSIEWQCLDENHNRDSAHIIYNIIKFWVHIYSADAMQPGGGHIPFPEQLTAIKGVVNPLNEDDYCFLCAAYLGILDLSHTKNYSRPSDIRKLIKDQGVQLNCSLEMPVEPTDKNFKQFEKENPGIHLNVYSTAEEAEKSPTKPLYIGTN